MDKKEKFGFNQLAKQTFAILTASLSALMSNQSEATPVRPHLDERHKNLNYENFQNKILKPKLVLKLNPSNPDKSIITQHTSHSSHRSHSSHSSHSSHASHYSSSPSYRPSVPTYQPSIPTYTPPSSKSIPSPPKYTPPSVSTASNSDLPYYALGSRNLYEGLKGTDVKELQQLLISLGYNLTANGVFGATTKVAVIKFQIANFLKADGIVGRM